MALFPITGYYHGDFVPFLIPADTDDTIDQVAVKVARISEGRRMPTLPEGTGYDVYVEDRLVDAGATLGSLDLAPLDFVHVKPRS